MNSNGVLLTSAGIDSFILWFLLDYPDMLYVRLGHKYESREFMTLSRHIPTAFKEHDYQVLNALWHEKFRSASWLKLGSFEWEDAHIPLRNSLLLHVGVVEYPEHTQYYLGALKGEAGRDKSRKFFRQLSRMMTHSESRPIKAFAPAIGMTKTQLVARFKKEFPQYVHLLEYTTSCHAPEPVGDTVGCGKCSGCFRRWVAMYRNGIEEKYVVEPAVYARDNWIAGADNKRALLKKFSGVDPLEIPQVLFNNYGAWRAIRKRLDQDLML